MPNKYSVTLTPVTEDDYELLSQWTSSDTWVYASGIQGHTSAADLKAFLARVDDKFLIVCTPDGQPLGMVSWKPTDTPGNYVVGTMIGDAGMWGAASGWRRRSCSSGCSSTRRTRTGWSSPAEPSTGGRWRTSAPE